MPMDLGDLVSWLTLAMNMPEVLPRWRDWLTKKTPGADPREELEAKLRAIATRLQFLETRALTFKLALAFGVEHSFMRDAKAKAYLNEAADKAFAEMDELRTTYADLHAEWKALVGGTAAT